MRFFKYHALGNDYIVLDPVDWPGAELPSPDQIRALCDRHFGLGSDGILWGPVSTAGAPYGLRIFNPDGSEAEKSGNGLRIFARYLSEHHSPASRLMEIHTLGGPVVARVHDGDRTVTVDMGRVRFNSAAIPVAGPEREVINEQLSINGTTFTYCAATIGNPHCVLPVPRVDPELAKRHGAEIEHHSNFPQRINVQFMEVIDRERIRIEIWERGAGYTLASGSSSSAAAAVAHRLGLVDERVVVEMPGGNLEIEISGDYSIRMTGAVSRVAAGELSQEIFEPRKGPLFPGERST